MGLLFAIDALGWIASTFLGLLFPAFCSIEAIQTRSTQDDTQWLTYWLVFSVGTVLEVTAIRPLFKWLPLYHVFKAVALAWLVLPQFKGAAYMYEQGILPAYKFTIKFAEEHSDRFPQIKKFLPKSGVATKVPTDDKIHAQ